MSLHAVDDIGDAFEVTRAFLTPFDLRTWLKLAVVVFFIGGGFSLPTTQFETSGATGPNGEFDPTIPFDVPFDAPFDIPVGVPVGVPVDALALVTGIVAVVVVLGVLFALVGAIMEFVFIESLRNETVSVRAYWRRRWRQGVRLFGFRVAIGLPVFALFAGWILLFLAPFVLDVGTPAIPIAVFFLGLVVFFFVGLLYGLVSGFTTVFVVPLMIQADSGVLAGWRRLWPSIRREWKQYLVYAVLAFVLTFALGFLASILVGLLAIVLVIPLAILAGLAFYTLSFSSAVVIGLLVALFVLFLLPLFVVWALVQVPVVTYLRYYALLVLGDIESDFDIIPEQRRALEVDSSE